MSIPSLDALLTMEVMEGFTNTPVPEGDYNAVITGVKVAQGAKGPYLAVETTIFDGPEARRKVWRNVSFSEKAVNMPGGLANLVQATNPPVDKSVSGNALPAAIAAALPSTPVTITVEHEQVVRAGTPAVNPDGTPEMRGTVSNFGPASEDFLASFEAEVTGADDDLPF